MEQPEVNPPTTEAVRLLVVAALDVRRVVMKRTGMNETELGAVEFLADHPSSPSELARHLHVSTAASTGVVDRLEGRGHIERRPHPTDRRRTDVHMTDSGRTEVGNLLAPMLVALEELDAGLSESERAAVLKYLNGAVRAFDRVGTADGAVPG